MKWTRFKIMRLKWTRFKMQMMEITFRMIKMKIKRMIKIQIKPKMEPKSKAKWHMNSPKMKPKPKAKWHMNPWWQLSQSVFLSQRWWFTHNYYKVLSEYADNDSFSISDKDSTNSGRTGFDDEHDRYTTQLGQKVKTASHKWWQRGCEKANKLAATVQTGFQSQMKGPGELQLLSADIQCGLSVTSSGCGLGVTSSGGTTTMGDAITSPKKLPISGSYPNSADIVTILTTTVGKTTMGGHHTHPPKSQWSQSLCQSSTSLCLVFL